LRTGPAAWDEDLEQLGPQPSLLQSWGWGEVQSRAGWTLERVRLKHGMASVQLRGLGPVREAYVPRGPVPSTGEVVAELVDWARERRIARLRMEPDAPPDIAPRMEELGFARSRPVQPEHSVIVTLKQPDELLKSFRHGRRYNIRAGLKRGVVVEEGKDAAELARQSGAVEQRESINLPDRGYYTHLLELLPWCRTFRRRLGRRHAAHRRPVHAHDGADGQRHRVVVGDEGVCRSW